jgi:hypothetical protein
MRKHNCASGIAAAIRGLLAAMLVMLVGCAGTNFVRPNSDTLKLGQTTYEQIVQQFGKPRREGTILKNDKTVKAISYAYAALGGEPLHAGVVAARGIDFYFFNDALVGYAFISSWKEDNTDFDETKLSAITKGQSTREEAIALLGKPGGWYKDPLVKSSASEAAAYIYVEAYLNRKLLRKSLVVSFDQGGVVSGVEFTSSGSQ